MKSAEIIHKTLEIYSSDKNHVAKYLKHYTAAESKYRLLCEELFDRLNVPILATGGISAASLYSLRANTELDKNTIFDSSDYYQFVLNKEILEVEDWDFTEQLRSGTIVRLCRLFINNCIPVYHLHIQLISSNFDKHPPIYRDYLEDIKIINRIKNVLHNKDFVECPNKILSSRYIELKTDLVEYNASIYECLFSDFHLLYDDSDSKIVFL